jgi:hypothetical protein
MNLAVHKVTHIVDSLVLLYSQVFSGAENFHFYSYIFTVFFYYSNLIFRNYSVMYPSVCLSVCEFSCVKTIDLSETKREHFST